MRLPSLLLWALAVASLQAAALSQEGKTASPGPETIVSDLNNPSAIGIQPETGIVFVAEAGAGRIGRIVDGKLEEVIKGGPGGQTAVTRSDSSRQQLSFVFVDKQTVAVGDGSVASGKDCVRFFKLPEDGKQVIEYESGAETKLTVAMAGDAHAVDGRVTGIVLAKHALYATSRGGSVLRSELKGTKFGELERVISTKTESAAGSPTAITISPRGELVVGLAGAADKSSDCQLAFYSAKTNELLLELETGLSNISAVAYSPKTGLLYATGSAVAAPEQEGVFRLDSDTSGSGQRIKATKIANLARPTAMAFDKTGALYITVLGAAGGGDDKPTGAVIKVNGL